MFYVILLVLCFVLILISEIAEGKFPYGVMFYIMGIAAIGCWAWTYFSFFGGVILNRDDNTRFKNLGHAIWSFLAGWALWYFRDYFK